MPFKNYFFILFFLLIQKALYSQFIGMGVRFYNPVLSVRSSSCSGLKGETFKATMNTDSLYFETTGLKLTLAAAKNKGGPDLNTMPAIACDNSNSQYRGRIYICWSSEKNGLKNKDVFIIYSDDIGKTWIEPVLVTYRPNHRAQVMPVLAIDNAGAVYILYYDNQNYFENETLNDVTLAISNNGGLKFNYYKLNTTSLKFILNTQQRNYLDLKQENETITASWNQDGKNKTPLTHAIINDLFFSDYQKNITSQLQFEKTISFATQIKISLGANQETTVTVVLTKPLLAGFEKVMVKNLKLKSGDNQLLIDTQKLCLKKGNYVLTFYYNNKNEFMWITED